MNLFYSFTAYKCFKTNDACENKIRHVFYLPTTGDQLLKFITAYKRFMIHAKTIIRHVFHLQTITEFFHLLRDIPRSNCLHSDSPFQILGNNTSRNYISQPSPSTSPCNRVRYTTIELFYFTPILRFK